MPEQDMITTENVQADVLTDTQRALQDMKGAFASNMKRNNRKIREDRALSIVESAQLLYRRAVEDLMLSIKNLRRDRDNMLDLSPSDANSLVVASDFDAAKFVEKDKQITLKIRDKEIELKLLRDRYAYLFGQVIPE